MARPPVATRLRRARACFLVFLFVAMSAQIWPLVDLVPSIEPRMLGLPFGLVWVVTWVVLLFVALLLLYLYESSIDRDEEGA